MFNHLTWSAYWTFMAAASGAYYLFVGATYYREEITTLLSGKRKKHPTSGANDRHTSEMAATHVGVAEALAGNPIEGTPDFADEKENYAGQSYEAENAQLEQLEKVELLAAALKDGIQASGHITNKQELCQKIAGMITATGSLAASQAFRDSLDKLIKQQASLHCHVELERRDLNSIWITAAGSGSRSWKGGAAMILALICAIIARAQDGNTGITQATSKVKNYFSDGCDLMYAVGAIVGLVGAVKVFNKWNSGDPDTNKVAAAWFGSCIFLVVVATILKGFFGV